MPELILTSVWRCYETDDSTEWEVQYDPSAPEDEQVMLREFGGSCRVEMSIETARALAALISAPVQTHDAEQRLQKLIGANQGDKSNG